MTERIQAFLLRNTSGLQYLINERLGARGGPMGTLFKPFAIGKRQFGQHSLGRQMKLMNYYWLMIYQTIGMQR